MERIVPMSVAGGASARPFRTAKTARNSLPGASVCYHQMARFDLE
ncbi:MAG TPA: hypothetical protein VGP25_00030 [Gemmatimonadaceae bacterium]|nr:hypothetical protein [Gemmatimonadaceae bacterium]